MFDQVLLAIAIMDLLKFTAPRNYRSTLLPNGSWSIVTGIVKLIRFKKYRTALRSLFFSSNRAQQD